MIAADKLLKTLAASHNFDHQSTTVGMALLLIDDVTFFEWHGTPCFGCQRSAISEAFSRDFLPS
jgi:hypothetical protein